MSLLLLEGFENYSSLNDVKSFLNYSTYQTPTIISSTDGVINTRKGLDSLKTLSTITFNSSTDTRKYNSRVYYPKFGTTVENHSNGVVGFAYYDYIPVGGGYAPFTPIVAICDPDGKPHLFICINSSRQIEVRRWNTQTSIGTNNTTTAATYTWNSDHTSAHPAYTDSYCRQVTAYNHHVSTPVTIGTSCDRQNMSVFNTVVNPNLFDLVATSSGNTLEANSWNYIEIEYSIATDATGSITIRINRNNDSIETEGTTNSIQTTTQDNTNVGQFAFGTFWAHNSAGTGGYSSTGTAGWPTYFDDIYALSKDSNYPNSFLGSIGARKGLFDTEVSNSASSGDLTSINDSTFSGIANLDNKLKLSLTGQQLSVKAANLSVTNSDTILSVQPLIYGYNTITDTYLNFKYSLNGTETTTYQLTLTNDSTNGGITKAPISSTDPEGNNWTADNLKNTIFTYEA